MELMTEEELYDKILDAEIEQYEGEFWEFLGITKEEYMKIHCRYCKIPK